MYSHTPGPWEVNRKTAHVCPKDKDDAPICAMLWPTDKRGEAETKENARLIARSPEMIDFILSAADYLESSADYDGGVPNDSARLLVWANEIIGRLNS